MRNCFCRCSKVVNSANNFVRVIFLACETLTSAKQAIKTIKIKDKLQDSVATCLRCGWVVNNQIKKDLLPTLRVKKNCE